LSYTAPVAWNAAMIATLVLFHHRTDLETLAIYLAWGSVLGSFLQFAVQWPTAWALSRHPGRMALSEPVRQIGRNFIPITISRGAVQLTGYIDQYIASWLPMGTVAALSNAQLLYTLPVSLFGASISAAELPALSEQATAATYDAFRARLDAGLRRLAFFIVPSVVAFAALGDIIAGAILQTGRFTPEDARYVWGILAGSSIGLMASTMGRLYSVGHYALTDAKRPLRFATVRLAIAGALGYVSALILPGYLGVGPEWGAALLTGSSSLAGWVEFALLRRSLNARIGHTGVPAGHMARLWAAALAGSAAAWGARLALPPLHPIVAAAIVLPIFGLTFVGAVVMLGLPVPGLGTRKRA
jgi:putative peptidoglycan lipid II flippase